MDGMDGWLEEAGCQDDDSPSDPFIGQTINPSFYGWMVGSISSIRLSCHHSLFTLPSEF